jgi:glycosyltransferase involved in cell wall biosynthesis
MNFAFFGSYGSFGYFKIGGIESLTRRLAGELLRRGHRVGFVLYGAPATGDEITGSGINLHYRPTFREALATLAHSYEQVLTLYLHPRDRFIYLKFRRAQRHRLCFHQLCTTWPDSSLKRWVRNLHVRFYPFNGRLFCISPRIKKAVSQWSEKGVLLLPPVPPAYFLTPESKPWHPKVRVTYIGRTEPAKGIEEVINLHRLFQDQSGWDLTIYGFHYQDHPEAVRMHEWLSRQQEIRYVYTPFEGYSNSVEDNLARVLADSDILLLPYLRLSSTIDTPVLLLEGMASLCAVFTRPWGDIPTIYGPSPFLLNKVEEMGEILKQLQRSQELLKQERQRIHQRNKQLGFNTEMVAQRFLEAIS